MSQVHIVLIAMVWYGVVITTRPSAISVVITTTSVVQLLIPRGIQCASHVQKQRLHYYTHYEHYAAEEAVSEPDHVSKYAARY